MKLASRATNRLRELYGNILQNCRHHNQQEFDYPRRMHQQSTAPLFEQLEPRVMLSANLPGMHLVDPAVDRFDGQVIYLDFDGEEDVTYNGPVTVENIDVPFFSAPGDLEGQEQTIITQVLIQLDATFEDANVIFTTEQPIADIAYSTIYVGGGESAFAQYGSFAAISEKVDIANADPSDKAFVFANNLGDGEDLRAYATELAGITAHETGHLLGYAHDYDNTANGLLSSVGASIVSAYWWEEGQTVTEGTLCHARAQVSGFSTGTRFRFDIYEHDSTYDDYVTTLYGAVWYENGNYYVGVDWTSVWQDDGVGNPEFYFKVSYGSYSKWARNDVTITKAADTTPPSTPSLVSPSNGNEDDDRTVYLDWSNSSDASDIDYYQVVVDNNSSFSSPEFNETPSSSSDTTSSLADGKYYWKVRARDNADNWGSWSSSRWFRVDGTNPSKPTLASPSDNSTTHDQTPYFDWYDSSDSGSGIWKYQLIVETDTMGYDKINIETTNSYYQTPSSKALPAGGEGYDWRVRACDNAGNWGSWTSNRRLYVDDPPDPAPQAYRHLPTNSSITLAYGTNQSFTVRGEDAGGDLDKVVWTLSGPESHSDTDSVGFSGSSDTADFTDYSGYTFDTAGDYTLLARVYDNSGDYDDATWSIHVNEALKPDLVISDIAMSDSTVYSGQSISLDFWGNNITPGTTSVSNVQMRAYWGTSQNSKANYIDTEYFGEWNGLSYNENEKTTIPSWSVPSLAPGTYWVTAEIDTDNKQDNATGENDGNNIHSESFTVLETPQPDLWVQNVYGTAGSYLTTDSINAYVDVKNIGTADANTARVDYYLGTSGDPTYRAIETGASLGYGTMSPNEEDTDEINGTWAIPDDVSAGTYYIYCHTTTSGDDPNDSSTYSDSSNNWGRSNSFTISRPNSAPSVPTNPTASNETATSARVSWGASNDPNGDSITYTIQWKTDGAWTWPSANTRTTSNTYYDITGLSPGTVYDVHVKASDGKLESDWNGRWDASEEKVITTLSDNSAPTINLTGPSSNVTVAQGQDVVITWTDSDPDDNAYVSLYRDTDTDSTPWSNATGQTGLTYSLREDPDGTGDQYTWDTSGVAPGTYSIWGMINDTQGDSHISFDRAAGLVTIAEANQSPQPDLTISSPRHLEIAETYRPGDDISGEAYIQNLGSENVTDTFYYEVRLSTDQIWGNADDIIVPSNAGHGYEDEGVDAGEAFWDSWAGTIPTNTPGGTYYVAVMIDSTNVIAESDETESSNIAWTSSASVVIPEQQTIFEAMNFDSGVGASVKTFITGMLDGADNAWTTVGNYLSETISIGNNITAGIAFGIYAEARAGEAVHKDIVSANIGMSVAYNFSQDYWNISRGFEIGFFGDVSLAGCEYISLPDSWDGRPVLTGLQLTGSYDIAGAGVEIKAGISKGIEAMATVEAGLGQNASISVETALSKTEFLDLTDQESVGMAVLDSFGYVNSGWWEFTKDQLGKLTGIGRPILSALGQGDDPLGLLVRADSDIHVAVNRATTAEASLKLQLGVGASAGIGLGAGVYGKVFGSVDLVNWNVWEHTFARSELVLGDDVGSDRATAKTLKANTPYIHNLSKNDRDYFSFMSSKDQRHQFFVGTDDAQKFAVTIYDSQGNIMERHTLSNVPSGTLLTFDAVNSDQYFIACEGISGTRSGNYSLQWQPIQNNGGFASGLTGYKTDGYVYLTDTGDSNYAVRLEEHSPASLQSEVVIPSLNGELTFDYRLTSVGDGDTLDVLIGDTVVHSIPIDAVQQDFTQVGPIDLSAYAGQTVELTFLLNSVGAADAAFEIDNILIEGNESYTFYSPYGDATVTVVNTRDQEIGGINDYMDVRFKSDDSVSSIKFMGTGMPEGLGIVIANATSVRSIKDSRKGDPADIAFIASDSAIKAVSLKSGLEGYDLNGLTMGGVAFAADVDGDGDADDETALWGTYVSSIKVADIAGDIVLPGAGAAKGVTIKAGQFFDGTDIVLGSYLKSLTATQWVGGSLTTPWAKSIAIKGNKKAGIAGDLGANLTFTDGDPKKGVALSKLSVAGTIDGAVVTADSGAVGTIQAAQWDDGSLTATWAKSIAIKGNKKAGIAGDLGANLTFTGGDPKKGIALSKLSVAGTINGAVVTADSGAVGSITAAQWDDGSLTATWAKSITTKGLKANAKYGLAALAGDLSADLTFTSGDLKKGVALSKLSVAGTIDGAVVTAGSGAVGSITAGQWDGGSLNATWTKSVAIKGNKKTGLAGDLSAAINLTGQDKRGVSLKKLSVAGTADSSTVRTSGSMGSVTVGAARGSDFLAGIADTVSRRASAKTDFVEPPDNDPWASIKSIKIKGLKVPKGSIAPRFFENSNFSAASIGTVSLLNPLYSNNGELFGFWTLDQDTERAIKSISSKDTVTGEKWKWPSLPLGGPWDFEIQII